MGIIEKFSLIDYRWGEEFELDFELSNFPIESPKYAGIPYDLIPHETNITSNLTLDSDMVSRFNPTVGSNATITVDDGVNIDMYNSELEITSNASLVIDDNVTFIAKDGICKITIDGSVSIGDNVSFIAEEEAQLHIKINNTSLDLTINNAHFEGATIIAYNNKLTITNSDFTEGGIHGINGNYDISSTDFVSSFVNIVNANTESNLVSITGNCNFSGLQSSAAIQVYDYPNFIIDECSFTNCAQVIGLFNCGFGNKDQQISNCEIYENSQAAITVYHTSVDILHNNIRNNMSGIKCFDRSVVHIEGDSQEITQEIRDNNSYEVYASRGSFPHYFHWNLIEDDDNLPGDPMVKYSGTGDEELDVTNNCWGYNFHASDDLAPYDMYTWQPTWDCLSAGGSGDRSEAEGMYLAAKDKVEIEDFEGAKAIYQQIVLQYPETKSAQAALKELYSLEAFVTNDYRTLKTF